MAEVTIRQLSNQVEAMVDRVQRGEQVTVTRDGAPVAQLTALPRPALSAVELLRRSRHLPYVDPVALRSDIDAVLDPSL